MKKELIEKYECILLLFLNKIEYIIEELYVGSINILYSIFEIYSGLVLIFNYVGCWKRGWW